MTELVICAVCGKAVYPDETHVRIEGETVSPDDRTTIEDFAAHPDCWDKLTDDWPTPA